MKRTANNHIDKEISAIMSCDVFGSSHYIVVISDNLTELANYVSACILRGWTATGGVTVIIDTGGGGKSLPKVQYCQALWKHV